MLYIFLFLFICENSISMEAPAKRSNTLDSLALIDANEDFKTSAIELLAEKCMASPYGVLDRVIQRKHPAETLFESQTWKTLTLVNNLWEHQLWLGKVISARGKEFARFRFDNDKTGDCNQFILPIRKGGCIAFDGPNNDGGVSAGVILVGHSYLNDQNLDTEFYLFKQHGVSASEYQGVQTKYSYEGGPSSFFYEGFPLNVGPLAGHQLQHVALAGAKRGLIGTKNLKGNLLQVFDYKHIPNTTDKSAPDHTFSIKYVAYDSNAPEFKKLGWIYGKTLLGISRDNELYILALDEPVGDSEYGSLRYIKQKTSVKFKDFAIGRPDAQHEILLLDEQNIVYYVNLRHNSTQQNRYELTRVNTESVQEDFTNAMKAYPQEKGWIITDNNNPINAIDFYAGKIKLSRPISKFDIETMSYLRTYAHDIVSPMPNQTTILDMLAPLLKQYKEANNRTKRVRNK